MNLPPTDAPGPQGQRSCREYRIAICCGDPSLARRYALALNQAGFPLAGTASPESLVAPRAVPGVIDLLVCDVDSHSAPGDSRHWLAIVEKAQPRIGTIAVTSYEDPRWIVKCIRRGALNCHLESDGENALIEIISECLDRHEAGIDNLKTAAERRHALVSARLRDAIAKEQIGVFFQPIVRCGDWSCERVEVLARWNDESLGHVAPSEFIAAAEEEGLVAPLGQLVLRKSLAALATLRAKGHNPTYSINVSRRQFDNPHLVKEYAEIVAEFGESPRQIVIEVTETARFENFMLAISLMQDFIHAGFQLAVDDFGTGESSFIQMSHVPYSELKIDRSLVSCVFEPSGLSIMQSIIAMAKSLNMHLVAEGVEDKQTAELLEQLEIDFCQGYYFAKPMPLNELIAFLDQSNGMDHQIADTHPIPAQ